MATTLDSRRRQSIPVIYVRGTHFDIGHDIGRIFASLIHSHVNSWEKEDTNIKLYDTKEGKKTYDRVVSNVIKYYPHYMQELKGMAEGANIPFHKLFLLHIGDLLRYRKDCECHEGDVGCTTLCINESGEQLLGHTEDAYSYMLNHLFIIRAHITESEPNEIFTALCYAGLLPGYSMGFNNYGLIYSINIVHAKHLNTNGIPRSIVARALLTADTFQKVENILRCSPLGIGDGMSVNFTFLNQKGERLFYNIEVTPSYPTCEGTAISMLTIRPGEQLSRCNNLLHLDIPESKIHYESSFTRHTTMDSYGKLSKKDDLIKLMGDSSHPEHNIFRDGNVNIITIAVGLFDLVNKTWSVYLANPRSSIPVVTMPIECEH